jgi:signal transduction histidine kinase
MLLAPLMAHEVILGVIAVTRDMGAPVFSKRDAHGLRAIADYAALALWNAELLEQAKVADRAKSRFLATVSHELRTPLTALAGYEELLADQVIGPLSDSQLDVLERMRSVTQHLASVIEELLAFSSLDEGREVVRPTDFLAADLVQSVAAVVEPLAHQKRLTFALTVPDSPIRMTSDVDKIRQILVNLAGNAVKFTDVGGVRLELQRRNDDVCFSVCDTGIGIASDDRGRLFKPFAQLDTGLTRRHGGTGLGLYISHSLAELLGGRIDVESKVGRGSTFTLVLPTDEQAATKPDEGV